MRVRIGIAAAGIAVVAAFGMMVSPTLVGAQEKLEPIKIELPEPYYGGTPLNYSGPNLEEPSFEERKPFMAPAGATNVAKGKTVTSGAAAPKFGKFAFATDGDKSYQEKSLLGLPAGQQYVQIDLGAANSIYALLVWHYHEAARVYFDVIVQVADDAEFTKNVQTVFNNDHDNTSGMGAGKDKEYIEDYRGKIIDAKGVKGRYVRLYSNGNTSDDMAHYVEVEVFGKPAA